MKKLLDKQKKSETISKDESPSKKHSSPILYDAVTWIFFIVFVILVFKVDSCLPDSGPGAPRFFGESR